MTRPPVRCGFPGPRGTLRRRRRDAPGRPRPSRPVARFSRRRTRDSGQRERPLRRVTRDSAQRERPSPRVERDSEQRTRPQRRVERDSREQSRPSPPVPRPSNGQSPDSARARAASLLPVGGLRGERRRSPTLHPPRGQTARVGGDRHRSASRCPTTRDGSSRETTGSRPTPSLTMWSAASRSERVVEARRAGARFTRSRQRAAVAPDLRADRGA